MEVMSKKNHNFGASTDLIHNFRDTKLQKKCVNNAIYQSSTLVFENYDDYQRCNGEFYRQDKIPSSDDITYGRYGTQTVVDLENAIAGYSGYEYAKATSCGMSAIVTTLLAFVSSGDHILIADNVYEPTHNVGTNFLKKFGVECTFFDPMEDIKPFVKQNTKLIFLESPGSLTFEVCDVMVISQTAKSINPDIKIILDNTWATSLNFKGCANGVDIVIESGTKFISGHSDFLIGFICFNATNYHKICQATKDLSATTTPMNAYNALRGLRTLAQRVKLSQNVADIMMDFFSSQSKITKILHPNHIHCPGHNIFKRTYNGHTSLLTICLDKLYNNDQMRKFFDTLSLYKMGFSWGGYESLITPISNNIKRVSNRTYADKTTIRVYTGLEDTDDLIYDFTQALNTL